MDSFLNPEQILNQLDIESDFTAADLGCGSGAWVIPLALKLKDGAVFAVDILEQPIDALKAKANSLSLTNIRAILTDVEKDLKIQKESCDIALMTNLLFEAKNKDAAVEQAKEILKPKARLLIVDWKKKNPVVPEQEAIAPEEIKKITEKAGLKLVKELDAGAYHYALVFEKNET